MGLIRYLKDRCLEFWNYYSDESTRWRKVVTNPVIIFAILSSILLYFSPLTLSLQIWSLGLYLSILIGHIVVKYTNLALRDYAELETKGNKRNKLTPTLGCFERCIYSILFYFGQSQLIGGLFALLIAQRLVAIAKLERKGPRHDLHKEAGERINIFVICNMVSLIFGILGGFVIRWLYSQAKIPVPHFK